MFRKPLFLAALLLILLPCKAQGVVIDSNWVGGEWGFWEQATNWEPAIVPDNNETNQFMVTINGGDTGTTVLVQYDHDVNRIDTYGEVDLERHNWQYKPDLRVLEPDGLTNHGFLEIDGELEIRGDVLNTLNAWLNGWFDVEDGNLVNQTNGRIDATDGYIDVDGGSIWNYGTIICGIASGPWAGEEFHNFGEVEIYSGLCSSDRAFVNETGGVINGFGIVHSDQLINNKGVIKSLGGSLTLHSRVDFEGPYLGNAGITNTGVLTNAPGTSLTVMAWVPDVNNQGTIEVNADGSVVFDCNNLNNQPSGTIKLQGGSLAADEIFQSSGAEFSGFGTINGTLTIEPNSPSEPNSIVQLTGSTSIIGDVDILAGATLQISDGTTLITGHCTCNSGTIRMKGGWLIPQGGFTNSGCNIIWEPGLYNNVADFNLDGLVNLKDFADFADTWLWQSDLR
jgi:hypothetical protein